VRPEDSASLGGLLLGQRLVSLGVVVDGQPVVGLLPYAVSDDLSALIVQASALARHSRGLAAGAAWSGVIHEPDAAASDPLQVPRLQLEGVVDPLQADRPEREAAARAFLRRFPNAATTLELPDFTLHRLELRGGRMVLGFGRALNLSASHFRDLRRAGNEEAV
jgi:heme oxygenase (biliverdin-IX-beta and delta-forming)